MRMKKSELLILIPLFVLIALVITTCEIELPPFEEEPEPNVVYSGDWRLVTIYLDGIVPIDVKTGLGKDRTMTPDTARWGFDYFEVIFYYGAGIAVSDRWELGKRVSIDGVYRNGPGIDYSAVNMESVDGTENGCALLFAGRKNDKTLLGVGKIVFVDNEPGAIIKEKSVSVTFEVSAFTGGANFEVEKSSFRTNSGNGDEVSPEKTKIISALFGAKSFPLYVLPSRKIVKAEYTLGISNGKDDIIYADDEDFEGKDNVYNYSPDYNGRNGDWSEYEKSIIVVGDGEADKRKARYPAGNGYYFYPRCDEDQITKVNVINNDPIGKYGRYFNNVIKFIIDTTDTYNVANPEDNGIFTFSFSIPVFPLSAEFSQGEDDCWYIKTGYGSSYFDIDNGITGNMLNISNNGGGVLIGVGLIGNEFERPADYR